MGAGYWRRLLSGRENVDCRSEVVRKQPELLSGSRRFRDEDKAFLIAVNRGTEGIGWVARVDLDPTALTRL